MVIETSEQSTAKRKLILHDALAFLSLASVTVVLFAVTLFLFKSFTAHRAELARRSSQRAAAAMQAGRYQEAIGALRTALTYAPGTRDYEFQLAQALGEGGHTEESYNYFMGLWASEPGNGFVNLELARLAAQRKDKQAAINFYRAAIYGTWEAGDGNARRPQLRLELARYLLQQDELAQSRMELLIAGGNTPDSPEFDITLGRLLQQADDRADAWTYFQKALKSQPRNPVALEASGRLAYDAADFESARRLFLRAEAVHAAQPSSTPWTSDDITLLHNSTRILQLLPRPSLPTRERAARTFADRATAKARFDACIAAFPSPSQIPPNLQALTPRWAGPGGVADAAELARDPGLQDSAIQLAYDTELEAAKVCTPPQGDDALLLLLANSNAAQSAQQKTDALP